MKMAERNSKRTSRREDEVDSTALAIPGFGMSNIFEDFLRPFDQFMQPLFPRSMRSMWEGLGVKEPSIDVQDRGTHYLLTAELPGFDKKDVEVKISSNVLELKAEKRTDEQTKDGEGTRTQRTSSYVHRYMTLPEEVLSEKVSGTMKNGILELQLPKKEPKALDRSKKVDLK